MAIDFVKLKANSDASVVTPWIGPSGGTTLGITDISQPAAAELNNTGGTSGMVMAAEAISWDDWDFGAQASETNNQPSMADTSTYETFGAYNFGGGISFFRPAEYDNDGDVLSLVYDLTDQIGEDTQDIALRIDGNKPVTQAAANGDYVHTFRTLAAAESNPFTPGESKRRTVTFTKRDEFAHYTIVGPHTITAVVPATDPWDAGRKARLRATVQGRDYTNALEFTSSDPDVVDISLKGGGYEVTGTTGDTATITIRDPKAGTSATVSVTVTAP